VSRYAVKRLALLPLTLFLISVAVFSMRVVLPGDPVELMFFGELPPPEVVAQVRSAMGLDRPLPVQFLLFLGRAVHGDLGVSYRSGRPVMEEILSRYPRTAQLAVASFGFAAVAGIGFGVLAGTRKDSAWDLLGMVGALLGLSMPAFWLGLLLIYVFSVELRFFPVYGSGTWRHMVLPALTLGLISSAVIARLTRSALVEVLQQDFIRTARAKGLTERLVVYRHALKNALIPVVTVLGLQFGTLLGGAFITETVFAWHGLGELGVKAIQTRDFAVVQGVVLVVACTYVLVNTVADLMYGLLNPRIRYE